MSYRLDVTYGEVNKRGTSIDRGERASSIGIDYARDKVRRVATVTPSAAARALAKESALNGLRESCVRILGVDVVECVLSVRSTSGGDSDARE